MDMKTENGFTLAQENALMKEAENAKHYGKRFATVCALMRGLEQ